MAIPITLEQFFQDLPDLPPLKPARAVKGTSYTRPSQTDIRAAQAHPETALQAIAALDINEQLQQYYFNKNFAHCQVGDAEAIRMRCRHADSLELAADGMGSEGEIGQVVTPLLRNLETATNLLIDSQYKVRLILHGGPPPRPYFMLVATEKATEIRTPLVAIDIKFGRISSETNDTLLGDLTTLLKANPHVVFPNYNEVFPSASTLSTSNVPASTSILTADGSLSPLKLPTFPRPTRRKVTQALWSLIHQLWSQMVASDLTFGVITDYNQMYIVVRVRATNTLYFSDSIDPAKSTYSLLSSCTGLFLLAFYDAIERLAIKAISAKSITAIGPTLNHPVPDNTGTGRPPDGDDTDCRTKPITRFNNLAARMSSVSPSRCPVPSSPSDELRLVPRLGQQGYQLNDKGGSSDGSGTFIMTNYLLPDNLDLLFRTMLHNSEYVTPMTRLHSPNDALAYPSVHTHSTTTSNPARSQTTTSDSGHGTVTLRGYDPNIGLDNILVLLQEIAQGGSGVVFRGYLDMGLTGSVGVIAKTSKFEHMEHEREIYSRLEERSVHGVPKLLGFYRPKPGYPGSHFGILVMSDQGELVERGVLSLEESEVFMNILEEIHQAGIIHSDIRRENLLRTEDTSGKSRLAIIDFHLAYFGDNSELQEMEKKELRGILKELCGD